jgi:hypothetical protein
MATLAINQSITRNSSLPLDYYSVFETYAKLTTYCSSIRAYAGQIVAVTSDSDKNGAYVLTGVKPFTPVKIGDSSSTNKTNFTILTTAEYEALTNKDANTIYFCTETDDDSDDSDNSNNSSNSSNSNSSNSSDSSNTGSGSSSGESSSSTISADKSEIELSNIKSDYDVTITSSSDVTYTNPAWVTVTLSSSSGNTKIYTISASENTSTYPRTGTATFTNTSGDSVTVTLKQSCAVRFTITADDIEASDTTITGTVKAYGISSDEFELIVYNYADLSTSDDINVTYTPTDFNASVSGVTISFSATVPANNTSNDVVYMVQASKSVGGGESAKLSVIQSAKS